MMGTTFILALQHSHPVVGDHEIVEPERDVPGRIPVEHGVGPVVDDYVVVRHPECQGLHLVLARLQPR